MSKKPDQKKSDSKAAAGLKNICENRKARFDYQLLEKYEAGLVLTGSEVKSLRAGKANLTNSYVDIKAGEAFLLQFQIQPYEKGGYANHEPMRKRKLLLNRKELDLISVRLATDGVTAVPLKVYFKNSMAKIEFALAKGKKDHDKRESVKERDVERQIRRAIRT